MPSIAAHCLRILKPRLLEYRQVNVLHFALKVVVLNNASLEESKRIDAICHAHNPPIAFIRAETRGVFASVFCDFGPAFTVHDVDGEEPHSGIVASISNGAPAMVTCVEDERLEFQVRPGWRGAVHYRFVGFDSVALPAMTEGLKPARCHHTKIFHAATRPAGRRAGDVRRGARHERGEQSPRHPRQELQGALF